MDETQAIESPRQTHPTAALPAVPGYEVLELVGRGGMGKVYRAKHLALGRVVALELGRRPERGLDSLASSWSERPSFGGRAIVLNSRSGGTERFLGRRSLSERQWVVTGVTTHRPRRAVWHRFGFSLSRLMDAGERTIPMLSSDDRVAVRGIERGREVQ